MIGKSKKKKKVNSIQAEEGYLLLSTIFVLILSGIMMQSIIKISTHHIVQLNQISRAYQAKTALNLAENILKDEIIKEQALIKKAELSSSVGKILVVKDSDESYQLTIITETGEKFTKNIGVDYLDKSDFESVDLETNLSPLLEEESGDEDILTN